MLPHLRCFYTSGLAVVRPLSNASTMNCYKVAATLVVQAMRRVQHTNLTCIEAASRSLSSAAAIHGDSISHVSSVVDPGKQLQQRYNAMIQSGVLKPEQQQYQLVVQLSALLQQLQAYSADVSNYRLSRESYEVQFQQRLDELKQQDDLQAQQEQQQQAQQEQVQQQQQGWFQRLLTTAGFAKQDKPKPLNPEQQARKAAAARRTSVLQELGPGPQPPAAPQGLYVYGSVGSGKSLLMDMFYDTARQHLQLDHSRRLHFNAAMLELHSRLHHLDLKRQQKQQRRKEAAAAAAAASPAADAAPFPVQAASSHACGSWSGSCGNCSSSTTVRNDVQQHPLAVELSTEATGERDVEAAGFSLLQDVEQTEEGCCNDAASDAQVAKWFDEGILRQKEAKAAVLAIRRHLRDARAGRVPEARLAAANASVMAAAARSFIRAESSNPTSGWTADKGRSGQERLAALLCFDEMQVGDVFSAAALKAMLEALTSEGCVVVTTSNRHPAELPRHGLHEAMFGHFLNTLFSSCRLFELSSATDFRRLSLSAPATQLLQQPLLLAPSSSADAAHQRMYFWPVSPVAEAALHQKWAQMLGQHGSGTGSSSGSSTSHASGLPVHQSNQPGSAAVLPVMFGRQLAVSRASAGVAWFDFVELCGGPLGAADYMAVAQNYHTVFISGIPAMSMDIRDQARRFITLVDELYNARCLLVCSAALPPDQLFAGTEGEEPILDLEGLQFEGAVEGSKLRTNLLADGGVAPVASSATAAAEATALLGGMEEKFAFSRAVSRLYEMQSPLYAASRPRQ